MAFGITMLLVFLGTIAFAALADGLNPPTSTRAIDPTKVAQTPPFDKPGLHRTAPHRYDAYYVAQAFSFNPSDLKIPVGSTVTFYVTSSDVVHGFFIPGTAVNMMAVPGWVNEETHTFKTAGRYLLLCHEYCGIGHQNMFAHIEVQ